MSYCTVDDIRNYVASFIIDSTSTPSEDKVEAYCIDSSGSIDALLRMYTELPVTDVEGLEYLKQWSINCVLANVYRSIESEPELCVIYENKCMQYRNDFIDDPGLVVSPIPSKEGVPTVVGSKRPRPKWHKNEVQW
jgi:hypothetical protein